ncbi:MAG TPA: hypothetical protein VGO79_06735 [Thermoanaerobaculia bacterium]|jgi:hypothetical protein
MRTRVILASLVGLIVGLSLSLAQDANMGVWKLDDAKSKFGAGASKSTTVTYEMAGENVKVTVDGTSADGKAMHNVWVGKYDGKDYPVTGNAAYDSRAYTKVDDHTVSMVIKKGGKVIANGTIAVEPGGKARTVKVKATDPKMTGLDQDATYNKQ